MLNGVGCQTRQHIRIFCHLGNDAVAFNFPGGFAVTSGPRDGGLVGLNGTDLEIKRFQTGGLEANSQIVDEDIVGG